MDTGDVKRPGAAGVKPAARSLSTGIEGLDYVLCGGLPAGRVYLVEGLPGSGKTTLSLQFLLEGVKQGERALYISLSETEEELTAVAESHGWSLEKIELFELIQADQTLGADREQSLLHPWEFELSETVRLIIERVELIKPTRVVFDSLSEMRMLAQEPLRYRRQLLTLKKYFSAKGITVVLVDDMTGSTITGDSHLHSLAHGVITLERITLAFGATRRRLVVQKLRGVNFRDGRHDIVLRRGGLVVLPRLVAARHHSRFSVSHTLSGVAELDALMGGGLIRGTSTLITGPPGSGKTNLGLQYVMAACRRGERAAIYEFDERVATLLHRAAEIGFDLDTHVDHGRLRIQQLDPAEISPGEFASIVKEDVERNGMRLLLIDSLAGYIAGMPEEQEILLQLHELLAYLNQQGVVTILLNPQQGLVGTMATAGLNVSYVADAVMLLRFFEANGRIRKAISVVKNRAGGHEDTIRELRIDARGVQIGAVLSEFKGVLTGVPEFVGSAGSLLAERPETRAGSKPGTHDGGTSGARDGSAG